MSEKNIEEKKNKRRRKTLEEQIAELEEKQKKLKDIQNKEYQDLFEKFFDFIKGDVELKEKLKNNVKNIAFKEDIKLFLKNYKIEENKEEKE